MKMQEIQTRQIFEILSVLESSHGAHASMMLKTSVCIVSNVASCPVGLATVRIERSWFFCVVAAIVNAAVG